MKKIILLIILVFANHKYANAKDDRLGYLGYSYSEEITNGKNIRNHSIGQEILTTSEENFTEGDFSYCFGLNYKFGDNGSGLASHFLIGKFYNFYGNSRSIFIPPCLPMSAIGANISYNLEKKIFGISPRVDLINIVFVFLKVNITYKYNIYFQAKNTHEIGFSVSVIDFYF